MRRSLLAVGALLVTAPLMATPAFAGPGKPPRPTDRVVIDIVKVSGSGCRKETATVAMSADNSAFTVTYSAYTVEIGPDSKVRDLVKDCKITVRVGVPKEYTFAIEEVDYRGFAHLAKDAKAKLFATYSFKDSNQSVETRHPVAGPYDDDWQATDVRPDVFEPCGKQRPLNIDTELTVDAKKSDAKKTSYASLDSTDGSGKLRSVYKLGWKPC